MIVFLDIGGTLVHGPGTGPAKLLAKELGLDPQDRVRLADAMMTRPWGDPDGLTQFMVDELKVPYIFAVSSAKRIWADQTTGASPVAGARATVRRLLDAGLRVGFISNIWHPYFESVTRCFGDLLASSVDRGPRILSYRIGAAKPSRTVFEHALDQAGVAPGEAVMIGDTYETDIEPASAVGMQTVWVLHRPEREMGNLTRVLNGQAEVPDRAVASIQDVTPELIQTLMNRTPATVREREALALSVANMDFEMRGYAWTY